MHNNYLMGLMFGTSWMVALTKKKFHLGIWIFGILYPKVSDPPYGKILQILEVPLPD